MNPTDCEDDPMNPPPIVTYSVDADDDTLKKQLRRMLKYEFSLRRQKDAVHIRTHSKDDYDTLVKFLQFYDHGYYTYLPPWHDTQLIVLREYIGTRESVIPALAAKGVKCHGVHVMSRKPAAETLFPALLLTLAGHADLDRVRRFRYLGNIGGFTWSDYTSDKYVPLQCHRCQRFRHDQRFCHMPPNCHTCGDSHPAEDCTYEGPPKCFNCKGKHRAYDVECPEWIAYKEGLANARARTPTRKTASRAVVAPQVKCDPSMDTLNEHVDSFWNLAQQLGIESMCFDYETTSITLGYGPVPTNGAPSPVAGGRPYKIGLRRSNKSVIM